LSPGTAGSWLVRQLGPLVSPRRLVSADSARVGWSRLVQLGPAGLRWFSSGRATRLAPQLGSGHWSPLVQLGPAGLRWFSSGRATRLALQLGSGHWSPLVQLGPRHSPRSAAWVRPLVSAGSARAEPLASLRSSDQATGLPWFSSGRLVSAGLARAAPLASLCSSGQATGLHWFSSGCATRLAPQLGSGHWSLLVQLGPAGLRCVRLSHSSVFWSLALRSRVLVSAAHFLSDARSPARANLTGIWLLSSVPHLWSFSFDCPASPERKRPSATGLLVRTHSAGPVSQICFT
jgi:hypothetical protein